MVETWEMHTAGVGIGAGGDQRREESRPPSCGGDVEGREALLGGCRGVGAGIEKETDLRAAAAAGATIDR